ncbi:MAG: CotH kinase family protein, partial [Chthoniobacteraceae bacterium]
GQWTHWAFVFDGAASPSMRIYRDHVLIASGNEGAGGQIDWAGIDIAELGASQIYDARWVGSIDDFALWDEALTVAQLTDIYDHGVRSLLTPVVQEFSATPGNITPGNKTTLRWKTLAAETLNITPGVGTVPGPDGMVDVTPSISTTFRLTAASPAGSTFREVFVGVGEPALPLVLNEFLADNGSGIIDEDGDASDWIEIYNPNPFAVAAGGWTLTDSDSTWIIPEGTSIPADGYRIIFASGKNRINAASELHTSFSLKREGEYLALKSPTGTVATEFAPQYPPQRSDVSCGRDADGGTVVYSPPTPGAANGPAFDGIVADTMFSVKRGFYSEPQMVEITTATGGATIRYTTNGSTPSESNGSVYSTPLSIDHTTVLRARAFKTNYLPTNTDTETYIFIADVPSQVYASPPPGWPGSGVNSQALRYGFNPSLKAQYPAAQLIAALEQIPSISIVTDQANLTAPSTGIYVNALSKGDAWERPASVELLNPDASPGFHINAGLRIRGGYSRNSQFAKHSLRLYFRKEYGDGKLKYPLHGADGVDEFDTIDLRTEQNYSWANGSGTENTAVREVFCRDLMAAMGQPTTRSRSVHLYLNGQYWGLYQTEERPQEDYGASYFEGKSADYDVVQTSNHSAFTYELAHGTLDAWRTTWNMARSHATSPSLAKYFAIQGRDSGGARVPGMPVYVDVDRLIHYMLLHYYTGDGDGPLSNFLGMNRANNWRCLRNRLTDQGWQYFVHDSEHTLMAPSWVDNRATNNTTNGSNRSNFTYSNPEWIHEDLAVNPEYRLRIADIAQRLLFNDGPMTPARAQTLFDARAAQIDPAIIADAVRWGTSTTDHTYNRWRARLATIRANFFANPSAGQERHRKLLVQLRARGFFPNLNTPTFSQRGGQVSAGFQLSLDSLGQAGTLFYTTDGSDPRLIGGTPAPSSRSYSGPIAIDGPVLIRMRLQNSSGTWSAIDESYFTTFASAAAGNLVISKLHYHPSAPTQAELEAGFLSGDEFEFIELMNIGAGSVDLTGMNLGGGINYSFGTSGITWLAAGERAVLVANAAAFAMRYGPGVKVIGEYKGRLLNSGEMVVLRDHEGGVITEFDYRDRDPWPGGADGLGAALVLVDPASNPDARMPGHWRASHVPGGRPGAVDEWTLPVWRDFWFTDSELQPENEASIWGDLTDADGDGFNNFVELVLGGSPRDPQSVPFYRASTYTDSATQKRYLRLSSTMRPGVPGVTISAMSSIDLISWSDGPAMVGAPNIQPDGSVIVTWQDDVPLTDEPGQHRFMKLRVTQQP